MKTTLIILILTVAVSLRAQNGEEKVYDINDPRNPNCPCHAFQKVADEEYRQLLLKENNKQVEQTSDQKIEQKGTIGLSEHKTIETSKDNENRTDTAISHRRRHKHVAMAKHSKPKKRKVRFGRKDNSKCTHW